MSDKHLWEYDHPYYCNEGNYFARPVENDWIWGNFDSWESFKEGGCFDADRDYNLLIRWDWKAWHLEDWAEDPSVQDHELKLYFVQQRKALIHSQCVKVTEADEPEVRKFLAECADKTAAIWAPFLGGVA